MTVKEAFSKAFGEVPDGATCHIGHLYGEDVILLPTWRLNESIWTLSGGVWSRYNFDSEEISFGSWYNRNPDISDRPASAFRGFFGEAYDRVLDGKE